MADKKPLVLTNGEIEGIDPADAIGIASGGTGALTAADARTQLGLGIGTNVQAFSSELAALVGLSTTGVPVRTGAGTYTVRAFSGTAGRTVVINGDGVSGNPTIDLATVTDSGVGSFRKITIDAYGRTIGTASVGQSDISILVDSLYVSKSITSALATGATIDYSAGTTSFGANSLVPKSYVDARIDGQLPKPSVRLASDVNVSISVPGAGPFDGVSPSAGNRLLLLNQTIGAQNGPWVFNGSTSPLTRPTDFDTSAESSPGSSFFVSEGTVYGNNSYVLITDDPIVLGTTSLVFTQVGGLSQLNAGLGLTKTGNTIDIGTASASRIVVNADSIDLALSGAVAGTYTKTTVDAYGRVLSGSTASPADVGAQPSNVDLSAITGLTLTGFPVRTGTGTYSIRTITSLGEGLSVTNGNGVSGNPVLALANDTAAVEALTGTGIAVRTGTDSWATRVLSGTVGRTVVINGNGAVGNPTVDLEVTGVSAGTYGSVTVDTYGRVVSGTGVVSSEATNSSLVNSEASAIVICQAVYHDASGLKLSRSNALANRKVIGLVSSLSIASTASGTVATSGIQTATTAQWDIVTGQTGGLTPNATYYLSPTTSGSLTTTSPSTTGTWSQPVGIALNSTKMRIQIGRSVKV